MSLLVAKLVIAPAFVVVASLLARSRGAAVGGVVGGLPVTTGPILAFIAIEQGVVFGADAAAATLIGLLALCGFLLAYALVVRRLPWYVALPLGWGTFIAVAALLSLVRVGPLVGLPVVCAAFLLLLAVLPRGRGEESDEIDFPAWSLPLRVVTTAVLVLLLTGVAAQIGEHWSGLLAPFPMAVAVLTGFTHAERGPDATLGMIRGMAHGLFAFAAFCFTFAVLLGHVATGWAVTAAALATLAVALPATVISRRATLRALR